MAESFPKDFGKYRLLRKLAQGGMAEIFLAQDQKGNFCAIKRILPHLAHEENFIRMFIDEARIVSHLDHPNIAGVYDQGKHKGYYYIAMEFVQGHSLLAVSERAKATKMELPRGLLAYVVAELLAGLGFAHSARDTKGRHLGIVHRDVTPQNVIISYDGEVKLIDFGVAKARARLTQTEAGFTKGKLAYMSPEQARGEELDGRSDLFSVGIILHEITTNSRLFNKEGPGGILGAIVNDPIPRPKTKVKGFPKDLETVVMKALEKPVGRRYQSAEEMRDGLLNYARKERPKPGQARLSELIHDLFGDPESQAIMDQAMELAAPTPEKVEAHSLVRGASVRIQGKAAKELSEQAEALLDDTRGIESETRMMQAGLVDLRPPKPKAKMEVTGESPALDVSLVQDAISVPEPKVPWQVKFGRFLAELTQDFKESWNQNKKKWILAFSSIFGVLVLLIAVQIGIFGAIGRFAGSAADKARKAKEAAGLTEQSVDAGINPTILRLSSDPPGATIFINGISMGAVTPANLEELPTGKALRVELKLKGYRTKEGKLTLWQNRGLMEEHFPMQRALGQLQIDSNPQGAKIYLNNKPTKLYTPAVAKDLPADKPTNVRLRFPGRISKSTVAVVADGQTRKVYLELPVDRRKIPSGSISVRSTPSGCSAFIDDNFVGTTPLSGIEARPGLHLVRVKCDNYAAETRTASVLSKQKARVNVSLRANVFGYLSVSVQPRDGTKLELNGRPMKLPLRFVKVVPGRHVIKVYNSRLNQTKEVSVNVGPKARVSRSIRLGY